MIISFARGVAACSANCATGCSCRQSFDLTAPDLSRQCRRGPLPELDLVDPRFAGAEGVESPTTQLQAGELASLNYAGGSSRAAPQVVLVWAQAAALSTLAQAAALRWARAGA
jgi:hypothetical protein